MKKKILIFQTGGTISMHGTGLRPKETLKANDFVGHVPDLKKMAKIDVLLADNIDSSNVTPRHWEKWLNQIKSVYSKYDGFVITHGTDTMVYTASAFHFAIGRHQKPLVFTGSQKPLGALRSDAPMNLINSVDTARRGLNTVSLCFGNQLLSGVRATKLSATDYVAFESFNSPHLATLGVDYETHWKNMDFVSGKPLWKNHFNEKVFCFKIFPGISAKILMETIRSKSCDGLVLEAYGTGNVPDFDDTVLAMIKEAKNLSKPVVISSQCPHGRVDLKKYKCGMMAERAGAISGSDMTTEACVVKLMHGLGMGLKGSALKNYFIKNIAGEMESK